MILAQFLNESQRKLASVGFPESMKSLMESRGFNLKDFTINQLLNDKDGLIEDSDIDIIISIEGRGVQTNWQVARYFYPDGGYSQLSLIDLIKKKCRMYTINRDINLVISIEKKPKISKDELIELFNTTKIPFSNIILINKASQDRGHFGSCQLYPKPHIGKEIRIPLLV